MERGFPGYIPAQNQRVHAGGSLQRTDGLQIAKMADDALKYRFKPTRFRQHIGLG